LTSSTTMTPTVSFFSWTMKWVVIPPRLFPSCDALKREG
jgi:hypothetical protein